MGVALLAAPLTAPVSVKSKKMSVIPTPSIHGFMGYLPCVGSSDSLVEQQMW